MNNQYQQHFEHHSKTFSFAAKFLGRKNAIDTAKLYYFFRYVDDIADSNEGCSIRKMEQIKESINLKELNDIRSSQYSKTCHPIFY